MDSRRDFLKKAALLSGSAALMNILPPAIQRALAINPAPGSTFYDAEHIVFLMQENRSFDHMFGALQGVRGFNDPRAIQLANGNKVWLQSNKAGDTHAPFLADIKDTRIAWMGSTPHNWANQTDARNAGRYDQWLNVKKPGNKAYAGIPLTLAHCQRQDFPFYYSMADAFTVCDQNFCSSITGTHSNRYFWMTGTNRDKNDPSGLAHVYNRVDNEQLNWKTYPERLEEHGVSWKIYQNDLTAGSALTGEYDDWLSNFGTNVLEFFSQYNVMLHPGPIAGLAQKIQNLETQISELKKQQGSDAALKLAAAQKLLARMKADQLAFTKEKFDQLSAHDKNLLLKAFSTNNADPDYQQLSTLSYQDNGETRTLNVPKGDVLHQFRHDVENGKLPAVSWLMPSANLSDHPSAPWFGPLYVSEIMDILTRNPEVWKKTVFILTYDENDGYFDHVPPFVVPDPYKEHTGKLSASLDAKMDFATNSQQFNSSGSAAALREGPVGMGFRVPMIIASPWTRGGFVCSEVFDHTSSIRFLENFLEKKTGKLIREENITAWRRAVCGDLSSAFRPYTNEAIVKPVFLKKDEFIESIHHARFKSEPANFTKLTEDEIRLFNDNAAASPHFPKQEKGVRSANALGYETYVDGKFDPAKNTFALTFKAGKRVFGARSLGCPFYVYAMRPYHDEVLRTWDYGLVAGDSLADEWELGGFKDGAYHLRTYGPNGFYREFKGNRNHPLLNISLAYEAAAGRPASLSGNIMVNIVNGSGKEQQITLQDNSYGTGSKESRIPAGAAVILAVDTSKSYNWYDISVKAKGYEQFEERFAGRVETGAMGKTDPLMGGLF